MSTDWSRASRLNATELHACWAVLDLGDTPTTLDLRHPPGHTLVEQRRIYAEAFTTLRGRGLADPHAGKPTQELADLLRMLAAATGEWDLWLSDGLVALGAVRNEHGLVAAQRDRRYALLPVPASEVPTVLVGLLGPLNPGPARPVNVPADVLDAARREAVDGSPWTLADRLAAHGVDRADAHSLARMCSDIRATAQLGGLFRRHGVEHRTPWVLGVHRAGHGDYLQLRRTIGNGHATVTVAPITAERLLGQARELVPTEGMNRTASSSPNAVGSTGK